MADVSSKDDDDLLFQKKLDLSWSELVNNLKETSVQSIVKRLGHMKCISKFEEEKVLTAADKFEKVRILLRSVRRKKVKEVFIEFLKALWSAGEKVLYGLLWDESFGLPKEPPPVSKDAFQVYLEALKDHLTIKLKNLNKTQLKTKCFVQLVINENVSEPDTPLRSSFRNFYTASNKTSQIKLEDLFVSQTSSKQPRVVTINGGPGYGKTHICSHLVEQTTKGLLKNPSTVPFLVCLRDIQNKDMQVSLKDFLLAHHGPYGFNESEYWETIYENQEKIWIILDGFDELWFDVFDGGAMPLTDPSMASSITQLIKSLIMGYLLPKAKLLITTRPHKLDHIFPHTDRVVDVRGLPDDQLEQLIKEELNDEKIFRKVMDLLLEHKDIMSLCKIPINAVSLIKFLRYNKSKDLDLLPKTKTDFSLFLVNSFLMEKSSTLTNISEILSEHSLMIAKIAKLCGHSFAGEYPKILFSKELLDLYSIREDDLRAGLLTLYCSVSETVYGTEMTKYFNIPHFASQELMAAAYHTQSQMSVIKDLIDKNRGQLDFVLISLVGLLGNPKCHQFLEKVFPSEVQTNYQEKAKEVLRYLMCSPRRFLIRGKMFLLDALSESQQWDLTPEIQKVLGEDFIPSPYIFTPGECISVAQYLSHLSHPHRVVELAGTLSEYRDSANALNGCYEIVYTVPLNQYKVQTATRNMNKMRPEGITFVNSEIISKGKCHIAFESKSNLTRITLFNCKINRNTLPILCGTLATLRMLKYLDLSNNPIGIRNSKAKSALSCLKQITLLQSIGCSSCNLGWRDVVELFRSIPMIEHVDLSDNPDIGQDNISAVCKAVARYRELKTLAFHGSSLSDSDVQQLMRVLRNKQDLQALVVHAQRALHEVEISSSLQKCYFYSFTGTLHDLSASFKFHKCTFVAVHGASFSRALDGWNEFVTMLMQPNTLKVLGLESCNLQDEHLKQLTRVLENESSVNVVSLKENSCLSGAFLADFSRKARISTLNITKCCLTSSEWRDVCREISNNRKLDVVYVGDLDIRVDMTPGVLEFRRPLRHVYILMSVTQSSVAAQHLSAKEGELQAPGMFTLYDLDDCLVCQRFCQDVPSYYLHAYTLKAL